ncbi:uncharacterized protein PgNI_04455 [Pyricularia grisea]|uniref:Uncharacterized protein n=1 Tax=Pyricularia grisea TaxID=148305 RepID=A0A6P8BE51_PYRGI|nr:uncharacterized protein PgNI_04455 [Pyricularia grisea]TLD14103.1 hypothetical protein PgNI_04455 [Pyricularia grisea]
MHFYLFVSAFTLWSLTGTVIAAVPAVAPGSIYRGRVYVVSLDPPEKYHDKGFDVQNGNDAYIVGFADKEMAYDQGAKYAIRAQMGAAFTSDVRDMPRRDKAFYRYHVDTVGAEASFVDITKQLTDYGVFIYEANSYVYGAKNIPWERVKGWTKHNARTIDVYTSRKSYERANSGKARHPSSNSPAQTYLSPLLRLLGPKPELDRSVSHGSSQAGNYGHSSGQAPAQAAPYSRSSSSASQQHRSSLGHQSGPPAVPPQTGGSSSSQNRPSRPVYKSFEYEIGYVQGPGGMIPDDYFPPFKPVPGMPEFRLPVLQSPHSSQ